MFREHARKAATVLGIALLLALFIPKLAFADDDDPPSRVARLAYARGSVSFQPGGTDDWVSATVNRPITTGDKLWSDNDGRVELQLDGSLILLSRNTGFSILNLTDNVTQLRLTEGNLMIRVRRVDRDETYEVDTPNLAFSIYRAGTYRLSVNEGGDTTVIKVKEGEGEVTGGGTSYTVRANDYATFSGTDQLYADVQDYNDGGSYNNVRNYNDRNYNDRPNQDYDNRRDDFDSWSTQRENRWQHSRSSQYVSSDVVGYEDLDDHGTWRDSGEYGHVWYPRVTVADWAPYHNGHWAYIEPWGYTWVDDEPWGFAPFHYGRWINTEGQWGWVPSRPRAEGVEYVRPVYAPALVAFVGGGGFSIGVSVGGGAGEGSVGWFPLGPREVYVPSYRTSPRYVENLNVSNTTVNRTVVNNVYNNTVINNTTVNNTTVNNNTRVQNVTYVNQRVPGAVAATSQQAFTTAQPVARNVVKVDQRQIASAPVQMRQPAIVPTKQAVLGTSKPATVQPPAAVQARAVVAKAPPPPAQPTFEKRQEAIKNNGGKPLSVAQVRQIQPAPQAQPQAAVKVAPAVQKPAVSVREAPKPANAPVRAPAQGAQGNTANQPGQPQNNPANRPAATPNTVQPGNRPGQPQPNQPVQPNTAQPGNRPGQPQPNQPVPPNATQPVNRPNERPNERPVTQPTTPQPANRPNERPNDRQVKPPNPNQPGNRPGQPPNERPATPPNPAQPGNRPADRPVTQPNTAQPGNRPVEQPNNRPADRPVIRPAEPPARTPPPAAKPAERPAPAPAERPAARPAPADRPATRPADRPAPPAERPAPRPAPSERPADRPADRPAPRPADRPAPAPAEKPAARPADRPADRPANRPPQDRPKEQPPKDKEKDKDKPPKR